MNKYIIITSLGKVLATKNAKTVSANLGLLLQPTPTVQDWNLFLGHLLSKYRHRERERGSQTLLHRIGPQPLGSRFVALLVSACYLTSLGEVRLSHIANSTIPLPRLKPLLATIWLSQDIGL